MKEIFDDLRTAIENHSVTCGGAKIVDLHIARTFINKAESELDSTYCDDVRLHTSSITSGFVRIHDVPYMIVEVNHWKCCPYCRKKIKISEVE